MVYEFRLLIWYYSLELENKRIFSFCLYKKKIEFTKPVHRDIHHIHHNRLENQKINQDWHHSPHAYRIFLYLTPFDVGYPHQQEVA